MKATCKEGILNCFVQMLKLLQIEQYALGHDVNRWQIQHIDLPSPDPLNRVKNITSAETDTASAESV